jgi:uncharacterized protein YecE (DUF72 family)
MLIVGTAGWGIPSVCAGSFPDQGTHLHRYAQILRGVEINSSFYRNHSADTYAKWARQTPRTFRFAVKLPQYITHDQRLHAARRPLQRFLPALAGLGRRLGPLLVQLPPSLAYEPRVARRFFALLRDFHDGPVVCEPRHQSWFEAAANALLFRHRVGRVAADPAAMPAAALPGGWPGIVYYRLHGSPRMYWSIYRAERLAYWVQALRQRPRASLTWCVFDNTAGGGAAGNALQMLGLLGGGALGHVSPVRRKSKH